MGVKERRERERDETRTRIMSAARDLFARDGYEAVSMRRIAEAIEYSPTAIYVHFKDKEALFRELCREDFGKLAEVFNQVARIADPVERILEIGRNYIHFALQYPNHYRLMFMTAHAAPSKDDPALSHRGNPDEDAYAFLRQTVQAAITEGRFRPEFEDAELTTQTLWANVHGVASIQITKGGDPWIDWRSIEARTEAASGAIIRGMLKDPEELTRLKSRKAGAR